MSKIKKGYEPAIESFELYKNQAVSCVEKHLKEIRESVNERDMAFSVCSLSKNIQDVNDHMIKDLYFLIKRGEQS